MLKIDILFLSSVFELKLISNSSVAEMMAIQQIVVNANFFPRSGKRIGKANKKRPVALFAQVCRKANWLNLIYPTINDIKRMAAITAIQYIILGGISIMGITLSKKIAIKSKSAILSITCPDLLESLNFLAM
nr:hypothetical protein [Liquorilactobacillus uvarum]